MGVITLRPDAVVQYTAAAIPTSARVSDNSDATINNFQPNLDEFVVYSFGNLVGLPSGATITKVTPRIRHDSNGSSPHYMAIRTNDGGDIIQLGTQALSLGTVSVLTTQTFAPYTTRDGTNPWTSAWVNLAEIITAGNASASGYSIAEIYLDVEYKLPPVGTATGPSGIVSDTTRPTWTHTYSDADNDTQTAFRWRIFAPAVYNAAGFDPANESLATVADSGMIKSSSTSWVTNKDLATGVAYRGYIFVYDSGVPGVYTKNTNVSFVTAMLKINAPSPPLLSVGSDSSGAPLLTSTAYINLLSKQDASFEAAGAGSWVAGNGNSSIVKSTGVTAPDGIGYAQIVRNSSVGEILVNTGITSYAAVPGRYYGGLVKLARNTTVRDFRVGISFYTSASALISTTYGDYVTERTTSGNYFTVNAVNGVVAPSNAAYVVLVVSVANAGVNEIHLLDTCEIVNTRFPNFLVNPSFADNDGTIGTAWEAYGNVTASIDTAPENVFAGYASQKLTFAANAVASGLRQYIDMTTVGQYATLSVWVKCSLARTISLQCSEFSGTNVTTVAVPANEWTRIDIVGQNHNSNQAQAVSIYSTQGNFDMWVGLAQGTFSNGPQQVSPASWTRGGTAITSVVFERSLNNGVTWERVRVIANSYIFGSVDYTLGVVDYEVPRGTAPLYRSYTAVYDLVTNQVISSSYSNKVTGIAPATSQMGWNMLVPEQPSLNAYNLEAKGPGPFELKSAEEASFFKPIGRKRSVKVADVVRGESYSLTWVSLTKTDFAKLVAIRNAQRSVLIQAPDGDQWYSNFDNEVTQRRVFTASVGNEEIYREYTMDFEECNAPAII